MYFIIILIAVDRQIFKKNIVKEKLCESNVGGSNNILFKMVIVILRTHLVHLWLWLRGNANKSVVCSVPVLYYINLRADSSLTINICQQ